MSEQDSTSSALGLLLMGDGLHDDTWGDLLNNDLSTLESAIAGEGSFPVTGGALTLTTAQAAPAALVFSGALTANQSVTVPAGTNKSWLITNRTTGAFALTVQTAAPGGLALAIPQGATLFAFSDGTNIAVPTQANPSTVGALEIWPGVELPDARYVWANGQAISRASYLAAMNALSRTTAATWTTGVQMLQAAEDLSTKGVVGAPIEGPGIPAGATITGVNTVSIMISAATTAPGSLRNVVIFPYGNGDGATTFNVPDLRERVPMGGSFVGGVNSPGRVTSISRNADLGFSSGVDSLVLSGGQLPTHTHGIVDKSHTHGVTDPTHTHPYVSGNINNTTEGGGSGGAKNAGAQTPPPTSNPSATGISIQQSFTGITGTASAGSSLPVSILQPFLALNYILRVA